MKRYAKALWAAVKSFGERNAYSYSAHITMALLLAVFPFTISVVSIAGILSARVEPTAVVNLIFGTWPEAVAEPLLREVEAVAQQSDTGKLTLGLLFAVVFASNGVDAIRLAVTEAYRDYDPRPVWATRILSFAFVLGGAIALIGIVVMQVGLPVYLEIAGGPGLSGVTQFLLSDRVRDFVTLFVLAFAVYACHRWLPGHRQPASVILPGVILTLCLWAGGGALFSYYLANLADYSLTYAGLAGLMATIIFLNMMAAIFILGAEFNARLKEIPKSSSLGET